MASSIKKISFPEEEIPLVKNQEEIVTHRVSKEFSKYQLGDEVLSPWGDLYLVVDRVEVSSVEDSPYLQFLNAGQKDEISKYGDVAILTLRKVQANPAVEIQESAAKYEPPYSLDVIQKVYGNDVYNRLKDDPVHRWRAETGIELIHKEPTKDEFEQIVANWNLMTPEQKEKSDAKSEELFGNSNQNRIDLLRREYDFSVGDRVKVRHGIRCRQAGHFGKIVRIDPPDKYGWSSFIVQFDDPSLRSMGFNSGDLEKTEAPVAESTIDEAGLIVNKKDGAYPRSGNVLIMAGGSGSGKSFILDKLLLFDGKVFNPDITLEMLIEYGKRKPDSKLSKDFYADAGKALSEIDLKRSEDANLVYDFIAKYRLHCEKEAVFFKAVSAAKEKPNVVFDVVMKNLQTVEWIAKYAEMGGYDPKNVNLVWVLNDVKVALGQNATRSRTVDAEFLKKAHVGVAKTMADLIEASDKWQKTIDGDIWIVFNKRGVDVKTTTTLNRTSDKDRSYRANTVIDDYVAFHLKERGKPMKQMSEIDRSVMDKILSYIPDEAKRDWKK